MKKSLMMTAIVLLTQVNSVFAGGSTAIEVSRRVDPILSKARTNMDELSQKIKNATDKGAVGRELLKIEAVRRDILALASKSGLPNTVENVVAAMPHALKSLGFIDVVREEISVDATIASTPKGKLASALKSVISRMSDKLGLDSAKESAAMDNLFDNAAGLAESLTPFLKDINSRMENGRTFKEAFNDSAEVLRKKYNEANTDKVNSLEEFIEMLKRCLGKFPA